MLLEDQRWPQDVHVTLRVVTELSQASVLIVI
jgi:hypothetical protein